MSLEMGTILAGIKISIFSSKIGTYLATLATMGVQIIGVLLLYISLSTFIRFYIQFRKSILKDF